MDGETMKIPKDFILGSSKIIADCDRSHEIKRYLLLGWKAGNYLDSIFKIRDIALPAKVHLVKAMVFPEVMTGKTAEHEELMVLKCGVGEDSWEWLRLQGC